MGQHGELSQWADRLGVTVRPAPKALRREQPAPDLSHPAMAVNLDACIQCNRCVRACREGAGQRRDRLRAARATARSFRPRRPHGRKHLRGLRRMRAGLPHGRAQPQDAHRLAKVDRKVDSVCPFCGVGCLITYNVRDEKSSAWKAATARPTRAACA